MPVIDRDRWKKLEPLVDHALELSDPEREAWLTQLRLESPELAAELTSFLSGEAQADRSGFLTEAPAISLAGARFGAWTLERPLGHGGMGQVWLARRSDGRFEGVAAVKLLNLALLTDTGRARFEREGSALARLAHPGIARLLDAGLAPGGQPYLVLEHIEGERIDIAANLRGLGVAARVRLVQQVLSAVGHAHANLVVHRDLKPSNILVGPDGTPRLLDFGIAKLLPGEADPEQTALTGMAGAPLTPEFAAPEQILGGAITTAVDVYAVGVLLYLLLTGRYPFDLTGRPPAEIVRLVCDTEPPPPSRMFAPDVPPETDPATRALARGGTPERLRRQIRGDLDAIVMQALRKEPERRYASAGALADDLQRHLDGRPVRARREGTLYRARKYVRRHRAGVALAAAVVAALAGAGMRERALRARAEVEADKARAVEGFLQRTFDVADPFGSQQPAGDVTVRAALDRGAARIDSTLADQPDVQSELRLALGHVYNSLGEYDRAEALLRQALRQRRALVGPRGPGVAAAMDELGQTLVGQDRLDEAEPLLRQALDQRRAQRGSRDTATATSLDHLATLLQERSRYDDAEALFKEALAIRRDVEGPDHPDVGSALNNLALLYFLRGDYDRAEPQFRQALAILLRRLGENQPTTLQAMQNLAATQDLRGHYPEAETLYRRALAGKRRILGNLHPSVTINLNNLGSMLVRHTPRVDEGAALITEAIALDRRIFGEQHTYVAEGLTNLSTAMRVRGDIDSATALSMHALRIYRGVSPGGRIGLATGLNNAGFMKLLQGDLPAAIALLRESLELNRKLMGEKTVRTAANEMDLARALREHGDAAEAEGLFRSAAASLDTANAGQRRLATAAAAGIGWCMANQGRAAEALPILESAHAAARSRLDRDDVVRAEAAMALGRGLAALGRRDDAAGVLQEAEAALRPRAAQNPHLARQLRALRAGPVRPTGAARSRP